MFQKTLIIGVAAATATLFAACQHSHTAHAETDEHATTTAHASEEGDEITLTAAQAKEAHLQVEPIAPAAFTEGVSVSGRVLPATGSEATVTATMEGIVRFVDKSLTEGASVSAGRALFVIDAQSLANGNPAAVAQSEWQAARAAYERATQLAKERLISARELEEAKQRLQSAEATARSLGTASQQRTISSSIGGYVKNILVKPGDYVAAGQALATVTQSRKVQLRVEVPERYYQLLPRITSANFRTAYDAQKVYSLAQLSGRLLSRGKATDAEGFFVPVVFEFNNEGDLLTGCYAEVYLLCQPRQGVLSVPNEAIVEAQGLHYVYVEEHPLSYRRQEVQLGGTDGQRTEVTEGLKSGDKVVTRGATQVRLAANASNLPEGHSHSH